MGHLADVPTVGLTADLEVVHPREVFPFPALHQDHTKQSGIMRQRVVPIDLLASKFGKISAKKKDQMEWWKVDHGDVTTDLGLDEPGSYMRNPFNNSGVMTGASEGTDVVKRGGPYPRTVDQRTPRYLRPLRCGKRQRDPGR
jgi:hypothetical protein